METFHQDGPRGCSWRSVIGVALVLVAAAGATAAETVNLATGEVGILGSVTAGDFTATATLDGNAEKIAENKDGSGHYRIDWRWDFAPAPAASYRLRIRAQATHSKHGMDSYTFRLEDGTVLGTVDATTMSDYDFPIAAGLVGRLLTVQAVDTNQTDDPRRSNQLWIDYLAVIGEGTAPTPLGAPSDLVASVDVAGRVVLDWTDNSTTEDFFVIERGDGTVFAEIGQVETDVSTYTDETMVAGETYHYRVFATRGEETSDDSNIVIITAGSGGGGGGGGGDLTGPQTDKAIIGYYPSWAIYNARKYFVPHIPFDRITHVNYAFANIDTATGEVIIGDSFADETNRKAPETDDGLPGGNLPQLVHYRDVGHNGPAQRHLKVLIAVGGWTWSGGFSDVARTPESRWVFAESLKNFVARFDLDGADLDWEYPTGDPADCGEAGNVCRAEDPVNHALLILACRAKLDELGPGQELTVALPADPAKIAKILPPMVDNTRLVDGNNQPVLVVMRDPAGNETLVGSATAVDALTRINVMAYDYAGAAWQTFTRHHAPLFGYAGPSGDPGPASLTRFNAHYAMQAYRYVHDDYIGNGFDPDDPLASGPLAEIPAAKLTLGIPTYGRAFDSVDAGSYDGYPGLFQFTDDSTRRRVPKGTYDGGKWGNSGVFAYWDILLNHGGNAEAPAGNLQVVEPGGVPYGPYVLEGDLFIGFDDAVQVATKVDYVVASGFGGVMFWDLPSDLSAVQVDQGLPGAAAAYPDASLVERIAAAFELRSPRAP